MRGSLACDGGRIQPLPPSSTQQEAVVRSGTRAQYGLGLMDRRKTCMCADNDGTGDAAASTPEHVTAIDVHAHAMPLRLLQWLEQRDLADLSRAEAGIVVLDPSVSGVGKGTPLPLARSQYDPATRLQEMDEVGVTIHAVSMPPFLYCSNSEDRQLVSTVIAHGNDELAQYVAGDPNRLHGLGSVPLGLPDAAEEARRCLDELGLAGIAIGSRGAGKDLDDPVNDDLWALLAERNTFVFLHPSGVPDVQRQRDFYLPRLVGYPMETALSIARMIFGKVFERYDLN